MKALSRFEGPVAFVDDEIRHEGSDAAALRAEIAEAGLPILEYADVPDVSALQHWRSLAFVILDWDFETGAVVEGVNLGEAIEAANQSRVIAFLAAVLDRIYCPVFLISAQRPETIARALDESGLISAGDLETRMIILRKSAVLDDVFDPLERWVQSKSGFETLRTWDIASEVAKNRLFRDLHALHPSWPNAFWKAARHDSVDPSFELVSVVTANLLSRIDAFAFDEPPEFEEPEGTKGQSFRRVLHGRSVLLSRGLYSGVIMPGDMFAATDLEPDVVWINLSPACHTVSGRDGRVAEEIPLYLVRAERQKIPDSKNSYNALRDKDRGPNTAVLHALTGDAPYVVDFREAKIARWGEISEERFGRILPPYITKIQQMNAMFMQVQGLPAVQEHFYDL